jgi:hypothetical protein
MKHYENIIKNHKNIEGYNIEEVEPEFMEKKVVVNNKKVKKQKGGIHKQDMKVSDVLKHEHNELVKINYKEKTMDDLSKINKNNLLLSDISFTRKFHEAEDKLSNNIINNKLKMTDGYIVDLYNQFRKAYDELFLITQIKESDIEKYITSKRCEGLRSLCVSYETLIDCYCEKKSHKKVDEEKVKMQMILTYYDELNFENFEETQQLLELFYADEAKELGIDFQLIRDIFNVLKDREKKRNEKILNMYEESNGDISDDSDIEKEEDNYDD